MKIYKNVLCRGCMSTDKPVQSIYEFPNNFPNLQIVSILLRNVPEILIGTADELPKTLCIICIDKLINMHQFREMCIASDIYLQNIVESSGFKKPEDYPTVCSFLKKVKDPLQVNYALSEVERCMKVEFEEADMLVSEKSSLIVSTENSVEGQTIKPKITNSNDSNRQRSDLQNIKCEEYSTFFKCKDSDLNQFQECIHKFENKEELCQHEYCPNMIKEENKHENYKFKKSGYNCTYCTCTFLKKSSLSNHMKTHLELESSAVYKFTCTVCSRNFKSQRSLQKHKRNDHPVKKDMPVIYSCKFCSKVFQQSSTLKDHIRTHTGEQPYLCSECGKTFSNSSNMKQHLLRHTGEKNYECPNCPKKFPCLSDLASHRAVHKKIKPHICDICGAAFGKPFQLKKHKMYHNGEKPHKCEYCDMRFVIADHMRRHIRTHTGEKPYKCKYCERAFTQSNDLIKHLRSHLGENVYKCELCPKAFRLAAELREHFTEHKIPDSGLNKIYQENKNESNKKNQQKLISEK